MIRVIVAEDHNLVRQGICALLEQSGEVQVVGQAATGQEAIQLAEQHKPDLVVMDLSMPRLDGAQAAERILDMKPAHPNHHPLYARRYHDGAAIAPTRR
ncbi:MAG: response regulator transcription factor [Chloroflexi bacterium]|nr:response regulator transcription factor [Chloroflexota bacterium]